MRKLFSSISLAVSLTLLSTSVSSMELIKTVDKSDVPLFQKSDEAKSTSKKSGKAKTASWEINVPDEELSDLEESMMQVVLTGEILEKDPGLDTEEAYEASMELLTDRLLSETQMEEPEELLQFYKILSEFETVRQKYFLPLLDMFLRKVQKDLLEAEEETTEHGMLVENAELIREVSRLIEQRVDLLDAEGDVEVGEGEGGDDDSQAGDHEPDEEGSDSEDSSEEGSEEDGADSEEDEADSQSEEDADSATSEEFRLLKLEVMKNREALGDLTERIDDQVDHMISLRKEVNQMKLMSKAELRRLTDHEEKLDKLIEGNDSKALEDKMVELEKTQSEILKLMRQLSKADQFEPDDPDSGAVDFPDSGSEEDSDNSDSENSNSGGSKVKVPFLYEYKVYGNDRSGVVAVMQAGNSSNEGSEAFDPRVFEVLNANGAQWSKALNSFSYKSLPTGLTNALGAEGVVVKPGKQEDAGKLGTRNYERAIVEFLSDGGKACFAEAARKAHRDSSQESLKCD